MGALADSPKRPAPPKEAIAIARRWRNGIIAVGVFLPIVAVVESLIASSSYPFEYERDVPPLWGADRLPGTLVFFSLFLLVWDWPFFVLAALAHRRILKLWPLIAAARSAIIGGLIGLLPLYVAIYLLIGRGIVYRQRGALFFLFGMVVLSPILGGFGTIGWAIGATLGRVITKRNKGSDAPAN
jgi:hypothetical protein